MSEPTDFLTARADYLGALDDVIALFRYRDAWRSENEQLANDIAELVVGLAAERDTARAEADALRAEVARLRPVRALFDHAIANYNYIQIEWYPSHAPDGATVQIDDWTVGGGALDAAVAAACDRLGVDHG